jgi:SAM-dependent methyltransferase
MEWTREEIEELSPILERIQKDLTPLEDKRILVLCSAAGDVALWLGERAGGGKIVGLELDEGLLELSRGRARERGLEEIIEFRKADRYKIPFADGEFDALVSEFVLFPTPQPTEIGQPEMARGLKPGGKMILTDVITTRPIPNEAREKLRAIGLDYLCEATQEDFRRWMEEAGLVDVEVRDFTLLVEQVWQARRDCDPASEHRAGYRFLLEDAKLRLGKGIFYIYVRGVKPDPEGKDGHTP